MENWVCEKHDTSGRFGECLVCKYQRELEEIKMINKLNQVPPQVSVEPVVILQITKIIDGLADEYSNEQKLAYMGNDQKIIRENDIKINTLMELKRVIDKSNLSK